MTRPRRMLLAALAVPLALLCAVTGPAPARGSAAAAAEPSPSPTTPPSPAPVPVAPGPNPLTKVGAVTMVVAALAGLWVYRVIRKGL